jgi:hypothetical protein
LGILSIGGAIHWLAWLALIPTVIAAIVVKRIGSKIAILSSGLAGEEETAQLLRRLPSNYTVISDLSITVNNHSSQIDHVCVGPTGVFVIESKHVRGIIHGDPQDQSWSQDKVRNGQVIEQKTLYNPLKQVATHVHRVTQMLQRDRLRHPVQGIVYFSNPGAKVQITHHDIPIFSVAKDGEHRLLEYIRQHGTNRLTGEDQKKIVNRLKRHIMLG